MRPLKDTARSFCFLPLLSAVLLSLGLTACAGIAGNSKIDLATLGNLSYRGIYDEPITLQQGRYEGKPFVPQAAARPRVQLVEQLYIIADLDNDGMQEAAVFLTESSGGSGSYTYLAIVDNVERKLQNVATQKLGDRIQVRNLQFEQGMLTLDMITAGPKEAACCATLKLHNTYRYHQGKLELAASEERGHVSLVDLQGRWTLARLDRNEPLPAGVEVNIEFRDAQFSGLAGCNRYFGAIKGKVPLDIVIGPIGATRMMCPPLIMQVEDRYLPALEHVKQFRFMFGQLALSYQDDKGWHTMLFTPQ
ncbi:MAG: META domain-containing protein [Thiohalomonadales bacterium]|nr:META domain-containing protein [Thiohalomonadales bacterium]